MSDQSDEGQSVALGVAGLALALVVAGVLALAVWQGQGRKAATPATSGTMAPAPVVNAGTAAMPAAPPAPTAAVTPAAAEMERLYFEVGSSALPGDAADVVKRVAEQARAKASAMVRISGFHDATGDPARNAELAKDRALAVRQALLAQGLPEANLVMSKPEVTTGGADAREARRVELRLQ